MEDVPYGRILREGWIIILIAAVLGTGAAFALTKILPQTFAATSTLLLQVDSTQASLFERSQFSLARIKSYPELVDSPQVIDGVRADLGTLAEDLSDRDIRRMLSAENTADTVLLVVRAEAPAAALAAHMANSAATHLSELIETTENSDDDDRYRVTLELVLPAVEPLAPISPQVLAITGLGLIAGLAFGGIAAVYRTVTNRRVSTISDVRRASGLPVAGQLPRASRRRFAGGRTRAQTAMSAALADTIGNLSALGGSACRRFVLVPASPDVFDDAILTGILGAFTQSGRTASAIDARSSASTFALPERPAPAGLESAVPDAMRQLAEDGVDVVLVVVDGGASALIERLADTGACTVIGVRHNSTSAIELLSLTTRLRTMGIRPLGVLMMHVRWHSIQAVSETWRESDRSVLAIESNDPDTGV